MQSIAFDSGDIRYQLVAAGLGLLGDFIALGDFIRRDTSDEDQKREEDCHRLDPHRCSSRYCCRLCGSGVSTLPRLSNQWLRVGSHSHHDSPVPEKKSQRHLLAYFNLAIEGDLVPGHFTRIRAFLESF